jgi:hypothetical protein
MGFVSLPNKPGLLVIFGHQATKKCYQAQLKSGDQELPLVESPCPGDDQRKT